MQINLELLGDFVLEQGSVVADAGRALERAADGARNTMLRHFSVGEGSPELLLEAGIELRARAAQATDAARLLLSAAGVLEAAGHVGELVVREAPKAAPGKTPPAKGRRRRVEAPTRRASPR